MSRANTRESRESIRPGFDKGPIGGFNAIDKCLRWVDASGDLRIMYARIIFHKTLYVRTDLRRLQ